uniref:Phospholipase A2 inhibitor and Ly6/PLAUR domain-containing protein-like n=1 Tax=Geotrypetes seraphini TaxID=260995 RepID=A0A6P8P580_GEOSA|nr:phospholipase A2 inhibitor and Ly6/PLAUR domain-containing protein-like [Geotrypetes seraphini]
MRTFLISGVCFLSALIVTVISLKCQQCVSTTENKCEGTEITCSTSENNCVSLTTETIVGDTKVNVFAKACSASSECNFPFFMTDGNSKTRGATKCCKSDNCENGVISLPNVNNTLNGLQCPSCNAVGTDKCEKSSTIKCEGAENRCIYYSLTVSKGTTKISTATRGCGSENICSSSQTGLFHGATLNFFECSSASCLYHSLLVPIIVELYLIKLLS